MYEVFEHTADIGLRVRAAALEELLEDAARGLFSLLVANLDAVRPVEELRIEVSGDEREFLLLDWLNELLYAFATQGRLYADFNVRIVYTEAGDPQSLIALARGEPINRDRHQLDHEVKAITHHGLLCEPTAAGWLAEIILDI